MTPQSIRYEQEHAIPIPGEAQLETDAEISAKRTAQMQQMTANALAKTAAEMEPVGKLTIIWDQEKTQIFERLNSHSILLEDLHQRIKILEAHILKPAQLPTFDNQHQAILERLQAVEAKLVRIDTAITLICSECL